MITQIQLLTLAFLIGTVSLADTRDQIRKDEIEPKSTYDRYQSDEYRKEKQLQSADGKLKTAELGAWPNHKPIDDETVYQFVLKVSCSDGDGDLIPHIPRNRPVDWSFKKDKTVISSGSAHVDQDGYVRFIVKNTKTEKVKQITVTLNKEDKTVDVESGPFDLIYPRKTCSKKNAPK